MNRPGPREGGGDPAEVAAAEVDAAEGDAVGGGHVVVDHTRAVTSIVSHGEIDASLEAQLTAWHDEAVRAGYAVTVQAQLVSFMDSRGAVFLARLYQGIRPQPLTVKRPSSQVLHLLKLTQLIDVMDVVVD